MDIPNQDTIANGLLVYKINNQIIVRSHLENIRELKVYDLLGRELFDGKNIGSNSYAINDLVLNQQPLIVKTILQNGQVINRKIVY